MTSRRNNVPAPAILCILCILGTLAAAANAQTNYEFNLPQQPLADALRAIGRLTTTNILFEPRTVENLTAPAVRGVLSPEEAIKRVLAGTKLVVRQTSANSLLITPAGAQATSTPVTPPATNRDERPALAGAALRLARLEPAQAPESADRSPKEFSAEDPASVVLQEVIVTAQKRDERLIDVPMSVSVLSGSELAAGGVTQFRDFAAMVPGLSFSTTGAGWTNITLRGVTTGSADIGGTVGSLVDDVPYSSITANRSLDMGLLDVERIEVLRGPQGTLYGASTMGGLIKYVSKRPDLDRLSGTLMTSVSSVAEGGIGYSAFGAFNIPLAQTVAVRLSGFYSDDGGYIDNAARGEEDVNATRFHGGRVDVLFEPSDALSIRLSAFLQNISRDGEGTVDYTFAGERPVGELGQNRLIAEPTDNRYRLYTGTIEYDFGPARLTSISGYQDTSLDYVQDVSGFYLQFIGPGFSAVGQSVDSAFNKFTQEVRLASAGSSRLEWLVGAFYTDENQYGAIFWPTLDQAGDPTSVNVFSFVGGGTIKEYAGFGDVTWHFNDRFDVTAGVRSAHDKWTQFDSRSGMFGSTSNAPTTSEEDVTTYLANARYHFGERSTAYLRYATGFRPGRPNYPRISVDDQTASAQPPSDPDELKSYELGYKAETRDQRFSIDAAIYYIDWSDIMIAVNTGGFTTISNASEGARVEGAELAVSLRPLQGLRVASALTYIHATLNEDEPALGGRAGERLPNVARFSAALSADYQFAGGGQLQPRIGATVSHVGEREARFDIQVSAAPQARLPDYTNIDLRGGVTWRNVDLQLFVRNLADERAVLSEDNWRGRAQPAFSQPRTIGVSATTHF